jgi:hypothetical protein
MAYPGIFERPRFVQLGRAIERVQNAGYDVEEDSLLQSGVILRASATVRQALEEHPEFNEFSPRLAADRVYEEAYVAAIARWIVNPEHAERVGDQLVNELIDVFRRLLDGLIL